MFKTDKVYRFIDGTSVVVEKKNYHWRFNYRDAQRFTIWAMEMASENEVIDKLIELERYDLTYAIKELGRFVPDVNVPDDEAIRAGIIAGLEDFDLTEDV